MTWRVETYIGSHLTWPILIDLASPWPIGQIDENQDRRSSWPVGFWCGFTEKVPASARGSGVAAEAAGLAEDADAGVDERDRRAAEPADDGLLVLAGVHGEEHEVHGEEFFGVLGGDIDRVGVDPPAHRLV